MLIQDRLKEVLQYDPETGIFTWKKRAKEQFRKERGCNQWNTRYAGKEAGSIGDGYIQIKIDKCTYRAHRLAWLHVYGEWPRENMDHINHIRTDNRIKNLREATHAQNGRNAKKSRNNTSGTTGVYWYKNINKWVAGIRVDGKNKYGGLFKNKKDAISRRKKMNAEHGFHENHGMSA